MALGKFDHHPDPAIDFCIEVEELVAIHHDRAIGFPNPNNTELERRVFNAMAFRVGGDQGAVKAKDELRVIDKKLAA